MVAPVAPNGSRVLVDEDGSFAKRIKELAKQASDLTIPLEQVKKQWYKGNRSIFTLSSSGRYDDIKDEDAKQKSVGFVYPLLRGKTKTLEKAITEESDVHAYSKVSKDELELGVIKTTEFPYAFSQHYGSKKQNLPARPYVLLGVEQVATNQQKENVNVYIDIIEDYIQQINEGK